MSVQAESVGAEGYSGVSPVTVRAPCVAAGDSAHAFLECLGGLQGNRGPPRPAWLTDSCIIGGR